MATDFLQKILDIINSTLKEQLSITVDVDTTSRLIDIGIDSIGFMVLIVYLENDLDVEINVELILEKEYSLITIGDMIDIILKGNGDES